MTQNQRTSESFWLLLQSMSQDRFRQLAKEGPRGIEFRRYLGLVQARVPFAPRALVERDYLNQVQKGLNQSLLSELDATVSQLERETRQVFGGKDRPLLLSVKSDCLGAIRNIGVSLENLASLRSYLGPSVAYRLYIDFLENYSSLVLNAGFIDFRKTFGLSSDRGHDSEDVSQDSEQQFSEKVREYQELIAKKTGKKFPQKPEQHLLTSLLYFSKAMDQPLRLPRNDEVFIQVQCLKSNFGQSVRGVVYTRDPFTGGQDLYGVFQGGSENKKFPLNDGSSSSLKLQHPGIYNEMAKQVSHIEACFRDVMEAEFVTDEDGAIYFTEFHKAETTARASLVSAIELNRNGTISDLEAALRVKPSDLEMLLHPSLDESSRVTLTDLGSQGASAAPGTGVGHVFFRMQDAIDFHEEAIRTQKDGRVILITDELLISDTPGLGIIQGLATQASGIASHAAVMARANGIPCIVGYRGLEVDVKSGSCRIFDRPLKAGELITLEAGAEGRLYLGEGKLQNNSFKEGIVKDIALLMSRVRKSEKIPVDIRVNINNPKDAEVGLNFGADGVGLCRTENMFMEENALKEVRNIIFSEQSNPCEQSFQKLEEIQFRDFSKIFEVMGSRVVNIRLMDLPLHDFAPNHPNDLRKIVEQLPHLSEQQILNVASSLKEHNPMLGLRASRFGLIRPQLYDLQIRAIVRAAYAVAKNSLDVKPGIMFPLVFLETELAQLRERVIQIEEDVREKLCISLEAKIDFKVGSMIELPAAALGADHLAKVGEFFAFGTNDLTQTTLGMSRDDSAHYLPQYLEKKLLSHDPFKVLSDPVKELIVTAVSRGRRMRPNASFGICGEQGGDPGTLKFCLMRGLNYVSCSPFRVLPAQIFLIQSFVENRTLHDSSGSRIPSISNKDENGPSREQKQAG